MRFPNLKLAEKTVSVSTCLVFFHDRKNYHVLHTNTANAKEVYSTDLRPRSTITCFHTQQYESQRSFSKFWMMFNGYVLAMFLNCMT